MAATGKDVPMNEEEQEAITDGLVPIPGEASAPALGSAREHSHNSAEGESDEEIAEAALDDGYANRSSDADDGDVTPGGGGHGVAMKEMHVTVDHLTKGQENDHREAWFAPGRDRIKARADQPSRDIDEDVRGTNSIRRRRRTLGRSATDRACTESRQMLVGTAGARQHHRGRF